MNVRAALRSAMEEARAATLQLFADVDDSDFCRQVHPDFSPLGWHLGHIGVTESYWILQQCKKERTLSAVYDHCFTPTDNPKPNRSHLPTRAEITAYLHIVRERVVTFLEAADLTVEHPLLLAGGIFHMLLQHEEQHNETILLIKQLLAGEKYAQASEKQHERCSSRSSAPLRREDKPKETVRIPAGVVRMGSNDSVTTLDNERPQHEVFVETFSIDR